MQQHPFKQNLPAYKKALISITSLICITSFVIFFFTRLLFTGHDISIGEDIMNILKILGTALLISLLVFLVFMLIEAADIIRQHNIQVNWRYAGVAAGMLVTIAFISSCSRQKVMAGVKKDLQTGLTTSYQTLSVGETVLVMNNETLHHTDIPLGEQFELINSGVEGFTVKEGKVKAGCSLLIKDNKGDTLLLEKDLFTGKDLLDAQDAKTLRCTIKTGEPMQWEENYQVAVAFWDKQGNGRVENEVTIRTIDIP